MKSLALSALALLALSTAAQANLISNGSFEVGSDPNASPNGFITLGTGSTAIDGWTVRSGSIDYIGSYWQPEQGTRSIDLSGNGPGSISTSFNQVSGQTYLITFYLAGNPDGTPNTKHADLMVGLGQAGMYSFPTFGVTTRTNMGWEEYSYTYRASTTGLTALTFAADSMRDGSSPYGAALDNVSVSTVPLPASLPLFGGALLALGGYAYVRRRRTAQPSACAAVA